MNLRPCGVESFKLGRFQLVGLDIDALLDTRINLNDKGSSKKLILKKSTIHLPAQSLFIIHHVPATTNSEKKRKSNESEISQDTKSTFHQFDKSTTIETDQGCTKTAMSSAAQCLRNATSEGWSMSWVPWWFLSKQPVVTTERPLETAQPRPNNRKYQFSSQRQTLWPRRPKRQAAPSPQAERTRSGRRRSRWRRRARPPDRRVRRLVAGPGRGPRAAPAPGWRKPLATSR